MSYRRRADDQVLARHGSLSTPQPQELADLDSARRLQRTKTALEDSTEAEKTIIQILSVVAVLVANVAFLGYVVPPGGPHPYWETCNYSAYISFFYFNGFAFLFSLCAVCVMIFMPWLLQDSAKDWLRIVIRWGIGYLALSMACFLLAFSVAGLVTANAQAPGYKCSSLRCDAGGLICQGQTFAKFTKGLNNFQGRCFTVTNLIDYTAMLKISPSLHGEHAANTSSVQLEDNCFFVLNEINLEDAVAQRFLIYGEGPSSQQSSSISGSNTLCMVGVSKGDLYKDLLEATGPDGPVWKATDSNVFTTDSSKVPVAYTAIIPAFKLNLTLTADSNINDYYTEGCQSLRPGNFTFVTLSRSDSNDVPWIYLVGSNSSAVNSSMECTEYSNCTAWSQSLFHVLSFDPSKYLVYDELAYRCRPREVRCQEGRCATLCRYDVHNTTLGSTWLPHAVTRRCFPGDECNGYAVDENGKYILKSDLASLGADSEVTEDHTTATQVEVAVYIVLSVGFAVNGGTILWLYLRNRAPGVVGNACWGAS